MPKAALKCRRGEALSNYLFENCIASSQTPRLGKPLSLELSTHHRGAGGGGAPNSSPPPMLPPMQELVLGHTLTDLRVQPRNTPGITWTEYHPFSLPARPRNPRICSSPQAGFGERPPPYPSS
ncbi:uncharacterized protein CLUP02_12609 [Colletotrichum lupini]|uniref:Uncharacterized protein n=1 Tax=Colletotrichum lupini TaxID=145971 RepID=A0A9Q8T2K0_9PEZI|nr:uncharacterized protein CLUP02_12609 [Colletotrichum lupini]UQC87107.1 hypothetical protein CLUP02_12609 [Colletotrichum lupini]